jgi:hypothetical protein
VLTKGINIGDNNVVELLNDAYQLIKDEENFTEYLVKISIEHAKSIIEHAE